MYVWNTSLFLFLFSLNNNDIIIILLSCLCVCIWRLWYFLPFWSLEGSKTTASTPLLTPKHPLSLSLSLSLLFLFIIIKKRRRALSVGRYSIQKHLIVANYLSSALSLSLSLSLSFILILFLPQFMGGHYLIRCLFLVVVLKNKKSLKKEQERDRERIGTKYLEWMRTLRIV